mgnify:CR=1 FL=1
MGYRGEKPAAGLRRLTQRAYDRAMTTVTVSQLWRYPVKSMGGTPVEELRIDRRGPHADRLWAVRDLDNDITASARRIPALLGCTARYREEPGPDSGPGHVPDVLIGFPAGTERCSPCRWPTVN